jgi:hypothetical protein
MSSRGQTDLCRLDEDTQLDIRSARPAIDRRNVCFVDFKDGPTDVSVTHDERDPSRIWITLRAGRALVQLSVEEGVGRQICDGLASRLSTFQMIRSRIRP